MGTEIFHFGQKEAEISGFKDFYLIQKSLTFCSNYCLLDFLSWVGIFDHSFLRIFFDESQKFLYSLERKFPEFSKTHPTFVCTPLLMPSTARQLLINKCPYQCIYWDSRSKVKIFKCNYLSIAGTKLEKLSAHQKDNFLNFSKHP